MSESLTGLKEATLDPLMDFQMDKQTESMLELMSSEHEFRHRTMVILKATSMEQLKDFLMVHVMGHWLVMQR